MIVNGLSTVSPPGTSPSQWLKALPAFGVAANVTIAPSKYSGPSMSVATWPKGSLTYSTVRTLPRRGQGALLLHQRQAKRDIHLRGKQHGPGVTLSPMARSPSNMGWAGSASAVEQICRDVSTNITNAAPIGLAFMLSPPENGLEWPRWHRRGIARSILTDAVGKLLPI